MKEKEDMGYEGQSHNHTDTFSFVRSWPSWLFVRNDGVAIEKKWKTQARRIVAALALLRVFTSCDLTAENAPCPGPVNFAGIRTFLSAPYVPRLEDLHADIAVVGVPFDEGTWNAPGARYGPRELREGTAMYKMCDLTQGFYYIDGDRVVLKGKRIFEQKVIECGECSCLATSELSNIADL